MNGNVDFWDRLESEVRALYGSSKWIFTEDWNPEETQDLRDLFDSLVEEPKKEENSSTKIQFRKFSDHSSRISKYPEPAKLPEQNFVTTGLPDDPATLRPESKKITSLPISEAKTLDSLRSRIIGCQKCELATTRKKIVFGQGNPEAKIMVIGEAPGAEEDQTGLAFVGRAGKLFTQILQSIGLHREDIFIANMVKCRPPGNRNPKVDELNACRKILDKQIELLRPEFIIAAGAVAAQNLLQTQSSVTKLRGKVHSYQGIDLWVIFHPSYLLRRPESSPEMWQDMRLIRQHLIPLRKRLLANSKEN